MLRVERHRIGQPYHPIATVRIYFGRITRKNYIVSVPAMPDGTTSHLPRLYPTVDYNHIFARIDHLRLLLSRIQSDINCHGKIIQKNTIAATNIKRSQNRNRLSEKFKYPIGNQYGNTPCNPLYRIDTIFYSDLIHKTLIITHEQNNHPNQHTCPPPGGGGVDDIK